MSLFGPLDPLVSLFKTKHQLEREISELRASITEAEKALSQCGTLEKEIPSRIAEVRARVAIPGLGDISGFSNVYPDFTRERKIVRAYERLQKDLPEIRAHWEKRLRTLTA